MFELATRPSVQIPAPLLAHLVHNTPVIPNLGHLSITPLLTSPLHLLHWHRQTPTRLVSRMGPRSNSEGAMDSSSIRVHRPGMGSGLGMGRVRDVLVGQQEWGSKGTMAIEGKRVST